MPNREYQNATFLPDGLEMHRPVDSYAAGQLGSVVTIKDTDGVAKRAQIVQLDSTLSLDSTVNPVAYDGCLAYWLDRTKYLVTTNLTLAGRGNIAGILRAPVGVSEICCIQQGGRCSVNFVSAPTAPPDATGLIVIPSATAGQADCLAAGSAATYPPLGVSMGTATANFADVDLDLGPAVP